MTRRLRILLVEDKNENIGAAMVMLADHELTLAKGYDEAHKLLEVIPSSMEAPFDVVLTDVMFPKGGNDCMNEEGKALVRRQGDMPYGPVVALRALSVGVKRVGILTQGSHHSDPFVFAFDNLKGFQAGEVRVVCSNLLEILVDAKSYQEVPQFEYSDETRATWEEEIRRCQAGELIGVKDWATLLEQLMS